MSHSITGHAAVPVVPDTALPVPCDYLYIGTSGDVTLVPKGGTVGVLFKDVPIGILPIKTALVLASGTDADDIVAIFKD